MNNYSKQRQIILDTLKNTKIHPTAEQIYEMVLKVDPKISRSTVYRNINILCENNQILKISMLVGPDRYDYIWKKHYHAICEMCGNVWDFNFEFNEEEMSKQNVDKSRCILVYNKVDKINKFEQSMLKTFDYETCYIEAKNNKGVFDLKALIRNRLTNL